MQKNIAAIALPLRGYLILIETFAPPAETVSALRACRLGFCKEAPVVVYGVPEGAFKETRNRVLESTQARLLGATNAGRDWRRHKLCVRIALTSPEG